MKGKLIQLGCSVILAILSGLNAFSSVWPSYAIKMLQSDDSPLGFKISENEANLVGSLPMLGSLISTMMATYILDGIGRKKSAIVSGLFYTVAWSLLVSARSTFQILFARFLMGVASGLSCALVMVYTMEITELSIRGNASPLSGLFYNCGVMISYLMGWFCSYNLICYANLTFIVIYVIVLCRMEDSPSYLLKIGKDKEALESLKFYRGISENTIGLIEEFEYKKQQVCYNHADSESVVPEREKLQNIENIEKSDMEKKKLKQKSGWVLLFTVAHHRRAITQSLIFMVLSSSMGMVAVQTYASKFFASAAPSLSPDLCSVMFAFILVLSNLLTVIVTDFFPRRSLMISTCFLSTVCLVTLGVALRWPRTPTWVSLTAVLVFCLVFHLGVINIVFVQISECYGPQVNGQAAVLIFGAMFLSNFLVLFLFLPAVDYIGIDTTFFVFAAIAAFTTVLAYFWIRETRRLPLEEIQKMFETGIMYRKVNVVES